MIRYIYIIIQWVSFLLLYSVQLQHTEDTDALVYAGYFSVSAIHQTRTLSWTTGLFNVGLRSFCMHKCLGNFVLLLLLSSLSFHPKSFNRTFGESAQTLTPEKSQGERRSVAHNSCLPVWWPCSVRLHTLGVCSRVLLLCTTDSQASHVLCVSFSS